MISISGILGFIVLLCILAVIARIIDIAPFIDGSFKPFIKWVLIVFGAIAVVLFLLGVLGVGTGFRIN